MIRLTRPAIPAALEKAAPAALKELEKLWKKGKAMEMHRGIYAHKAVKTALRKAQFNKCAYCETLNSTSKGVVEHYRPHSGWKQVRDDLLHYPEYFWLAYEWENLLFACDDCNDQGHKANLFPLVNPQQRATAVDKDIKREKPLILNPYGNSDPEKHIAWNRDVPRPRNGSRTGRVTIETFRLDQPSLLFTKRKDHFAETEGMLEAAEVLPPDEPVRIKVTAFLKVRASKRGAWSAMIRANLNERIAAL